MHVRGWGCTLAATAMLAAPGKKRWRALMTAIDDELSQQQVMVSTYALHSHAAGSGA